MANITAKTAINIKASPEDVFRYLKTLKYYYYWNPSLKILSYEGDIKEGMTYESEAVILKDIVIKSKNTVTKFVPNQEIHQHNSTGMLQYESYIKLTKQAKTTHVVCSIDVLTESKAFGLTAPVLRQLAKRELQTDLQGLKIAVENRLGQ